MRKQNQKGFTLVELMVVVTIIGILAAIAIPRVFSYIRTSSTAEVAQDASSITGAISGYAQSQLQTAAALKTQVDGTTATPDLSGTNEISTVIPQVQIPKDAHFDYAISAAIATAGPSSGELVYCILATGRANAAVAGGKVLYSSVASTAAGWDGHVNRSTFVNGLTTLTGVNAGGYCSATGAAQATFLTLRAFMRTEFGHAWGKLYLAMLAMATSSEPLPQRVTEAFRLHLSSLGRQNLPAFAHERLAAMRLKLLRSPQDADDDQTVDPSALSNKEAVAIAEDIFSLYDEVARSDARDRAASPT